MGLIFPLFLVFFIGLALAKKNDLEELESILDELDESRAGDSGAEQRQESEQQLGQLRASETNPCDQHVCGWGKECVVDKKGRPVCECIAKCPELDNDPLDQLNNKTMRFVKFVTRKPRSLPPKKTKSIVARRADTMAYALQMNDSRTFWGKKFKCSFTWLLERYKLSDKHAIKEKIEVKYPGHRKFVFMTAINDNYMPNLRMLIANIKQRFGCTQKMIVYDLGNVSTNSEWLSELNSVCHLELRIFNFSQMVTGRVRRLKSYAWKVFSIADVLMDHDTVIWVDTSLNFQRTKLAPILAPIQTGKIGSVEQPSITGHGSNIATHPGMYKYLPMYTNFESGNGAAVADPLQFEANFLILHKTEQTRQLMKCMALLCAAEPDCIVPIGETKERCITTPPIWPNLTCHRQDQSLFGILRYNMDYRQQIEDPSFLPHINRAHPRWSTGVTRLFQVHRRQIFNGTASEWHQKVKCCCLFQVHRRQIFNGTASEWHQKVKCC